MKVCDSVGARYTQRELSRLTSRSSIHALTTNWSSLSRDISRDQESVLTKILGQLCRLFLLSEPLSFFTEEQNAGPDEIWYRVKHVDWHCESVLLLLEANRLNKANLVELISILVAEVLDDPSHLIVTSFHERLLTLGVQEEVLDHLVCRILPPHFLGVCKQPVWKFESLSLISLTLKLGLHFFQPTILQLKTN